jgi:allantoinase
MMSIGLHPRIIGRPGRIKGLEGLLKHIQTINSSWVSSRAEIANWFQKLNF